MGFMVVPGETHAFHNHPLNCHQLFRTSRAKFAKISAYIYRPPPNCSLKSCGRRAFAAARVSAWNTAGLERRRIDSEGPQWPPNALRVHFRRSPSSHCRPLAHHGDQQLRGSNASSSTLLKRVRLVQGKRADAMSPQRRSKASIRHRAERSAKCHLTSSGPGFPQQQNALGL